MYLQQNDDNIGKVLENSLLLDSDDVINEPLSFDLEDAVRSLDSVTDTSEIFDKEEASSDISEYDFVQESITKKSVQYNVYTPAQWDNEYIVHNGEEETIPVDTETDKIDYDAEFNVRTSVLNFVHFSQKYFQSVYISILSIFEPYQLYMVQLLPLEYSFFGVEICFSSSGISTAATICLLFFLFLSLLFAILVYRVIVSTFSKNTKTNAEKPIHEDAMTEGSTSTCGTPLSSMSFDGLIPSQSPGRSNAGTCVSTPDSKQREFVAVKTPRRTADGVQVPEVMSLEKIKLQQPIMHGMQISSVYLHRDTRETAKAEVDARRLAKQMEERIKQTPKAFVKEKKLEEEQEE
eukprot:CAMPEP_0182427510 /NCGR_PEP_ID=MMETSP1167-20130531/18053_1 /TAXON_ID=2988 /ORGANISM="Mallomonas Sp, Strain CCMP3275" /LENGTH=348 /DNA_ID=CAMNT_0024609809 /DNA_START=180 /DNA_END=1227 /DNA_ORIENTATION=+